MAYPDDFIPEIWSTTLLDTLDNALVLGARANRNYQGDIQNVGDTVRIQTPGNLTVNTYSGTVTYQTPTSTTQTLLIDQDKYVAFDVDDLDAIQSNIDNVQVYTDRAAFGLADDVDSFIGSLYTAATAGNITFTLATSDAWADVVVVAAQNLDTNNAPRTGRWMVVTPAGFAAMLKNSNFIHASQLGDTVLRTGMVGVLGGFEIFVSNNLTFVAGTPNSTKALYGHTSGITLAMQMIGTPEAVRRDASFSVGVRARIAYGAKVVQPSVVGVISEE